MSLYLDTLYHYSPVEKYVDIIKEGLKLYSPSNSLEGYSFPYICLATTPSSAWGLSGDTGWGEEVEEWDLWQVSLRDTDHIKIRGDFCPAIREVRVFNSLPADRLWWVGRRELPCAMEIGSTSSDNQEEKRASGSPEAKRRSSKTR